MKEMTLYQAIKKNPNAVIYHTGCQIDEELETGGTWCIKHGVTICRICLKEIKEGEVYCEDHVR